MSVSTIGRPRKHAAGTVSLLFTLLIAACGQEASTPTAPATSAESAASDVSTPSATTVAAPEIAAWDENYPQIDYPSFAVLGVQIGDTMSQVQDKLSATGTNFGFQRLEDDIGNIVGSAIRGLLYESTLHVTELTRAGLPKPYGQIISTAFTAPPEEGVLTALVRRVPFEQHMVRADLRAQLVAKYGEPRYEDPQTLSWSIGTDGQAIVDPALIKQCDGARRSSRGPYLNDMRSSDARPGPYERCGFTFIVHFQPHNNPDLISTMSVLMMDVGLLRTRSNAAVAYSEIEAENLRAAEMQNAREATQGQAPAL